MLPALEYINQLPCPIVFPYYGSVPVHLSYTSTQFRRGATLLEKLLLYWETSKSWQFLRSPHSQLLKA